MPAPLHSLPLPRLVAALRANVFSKPINPIEEAEGFDRLVACDWSLQRIARSTKHSCPTVRNALAMLRLPTQVQKWIARGVLSPRSARGLIGYVSPHGGALNFKPQPKICIAVARLAIETGISTEKLSLSNLRKKERA